MGIAYLLDALALSFDSDSQWNTSQISILKNEESVKICHASRPVHVQENADRIRDWLEKDDPWLKHGLPKRGQYTYKPQKNYYVEKLSDFPTKIYRNQKAFIDDRKWLWIWHEEEKHWDVQKFPYGKDNYVKVASDGKLLDD